MYSSGLLVGLTPISLYCIKKKKTQKGQDKIKTRDKMWNVAKNVIAKKKKKNFLWTAYYEKYTSSQSYKWCAVPTVKQITQFIFWKNKPKYMKIR